jgi:diguanylate cyclase (GGDEF)-like protein
MLDIDHFKAVNDNHGHLAGDAILKGVGNLLTSQARAIDRVCRYGGEEITVILPETNGDAAVNIAERLRTTVEQERFDIGDGQIIHVTVSIGVASWSVQVGDAKALVAASDVALYAAKQGGRNCVRRYEAGIGDGINAPASPGTARQDTSQSPVAD